MEWAVPKPSTGPALLSVDDERARAYDRGAMPGIALWSCCEKPLKRFLAEDLGQDLTEYALLLAFVVLSSAATFLISSSSFTGIWGSANSLLVNASTAAVS